MHAAHDPELANILLYTLLTSLNLRLAARAGVEPEILTHDIHQKILPKQNHPIVGKVLVGLPAFDEVFLGPIAGDQPVVVVVVSAVMATDGRAAQYLLPNCWEPIGINLFYIKGGGNQGAVEVNVGGLPQAPYVVPGLASPTVSLPVKGGVILLLAGWAGSARHPMVPGLGVDALRVRDPIRPFLEE